MSEPLVGAQQPILGNKGYFLSTSIDGSMPKSFPEYQTTPPQAIQVRDMESENQVITDKQDLKGKVDYDIPETNDDNNRMSSKRQVYDWRRNNQNVYDLNNHHKDSKQNDAENNSKYPEYIYCESNI